MSRVLAVDWGTRRIGLAVSDPTRVLARSLPTLEVTGPRKAALAVLEVARAQEVEEILIGLPLHFHGAEGESSRAARRLGETLAAEGFRVDYRDERLTSEEARDLLREKGETRPAPGRVDQLAALILLQEFLDEEGRARDRA